MQNTLTRPAASIDCLQLAAHEPWRDVVAELDPEPPRRPDHRRQRLDLDDDAYGTGRDGLGAELFDKTDLGSNREHDLATLPPLGGPSR